MKNLLLYLFISISLGIGATSCSDDCGHTGQVTLSFQRILANGVNINVDFYTIDGGNTLILQDQLDYQMSYTTTLNIGNYKVKVYAEKTFEKVVGFQISPDKNAIISFDGNFTPTLTYEH